MHKIAPSDDPPSAAPVLPPPTSSGVPWRAAALLVLVAHAGTIGFIAAHRPADLGPQAATLQFDLVPPEALPTAPPPVEVPPPPAPPPPPEPEPEPEMLAAAPPPEPEPEPPAAPPPPPPKPKKKRPPPKAEAPPPAPAPTPVVDEEPAPDLAAPPGPVAAPVAAAPAPAPLIAPSHDASYLRNPQPPYPLRSRQLGEEGKVNLRVCVEIDGKPSSVAVDRSSGFERLDSSALQTVRAKWTFKPARRGDDPVRDCYIVPVDFTLGG